MLAAGPEDRLVRTTISDSGIATVRVMGIGSSTSRGVPGRYREILIATERDPECIIDCSAAAACVSRSCAWAPPTACPTDEPSRMDAGHPRLSERNLAIARVVGEVAAELDVPAAAVAVAWVLGRPGVMIPILGARRAGQLEQSLQGADVELSAEQVARLEEISHVDLGFPHEFLAGDMNDALVFGGAKDSLRLHRGPLAR